MRFDAYVFDLDGTILDTLPDLVDLTNAVMDACGYPRHTTQEVLSYIGAGARVLLERAMPAGASAGEGVPDDARSARVDEMLRLWEELYPVYGHLQTKPYVGMPEALAALRAQGLKLGVLSNKIDSAARDVVERHFPGVFHLVRGEGPATPRKPDPAGLLQMCSDLGVSPERVAFVGDSGATDMAVACAAGAYPVGVSWGYQSVEALRTHGARCILDAPRELPALL